MANRKAAAKVVAGNNLGVPDVFWKEGEPQPDWIHDPLLHTSPVVAQAFLDATSKPVAYSFTDAEILGESPQEVNANWQSISATNSVGQLMLF